MAYFLSSVFPAFQNKADKITFSRVVTTVLSTIFYFSGWYILIIPCDISSVASDWYDGHTARKHGPTAFGARFDATADKFFACSKMYMIWDSLREIPQAALGLWWMNILICFEVSLFILAGILYLLLRAEIKSNWFGKGKMSIEYAMALTWTLAFCNPFVQCLNSPLIILALTIMICASVAFAFGSVVGYIREYGSPSLRIISEFVWKRLGQYSS